ncbi:MAG TPA: isopentenyl-diphosphate Delta-isomerase [Flavisolibacter sp.]|jgi:isopentenyl-diphosphate delta-isomerase|nr:isopentenyl-diphosphate Delta-isomerase [Flavisolibacter sp.]
MKQQDVILVTADDEPIGAMEKMMAHQKGLLHRAFSVFIFDRAGRMLLQQRAAQKYHGGLLWTNACCSHPYPGERVEQAAQRRLKEELGFITPLKKIFSFTYQAHVENNLIEHEFDHVFAGIYEGEIGLNKEEVAACSYHTMEEIKLFLKQRPAEFTAWFKLAFPRLESWWKANYEMEEAGSMK